MKKRKITFALIAILIIAASLSMVGCGESKKYNEALEFFKAEDYKNALTLYTELGDYKDSPQMAYECKWSILYSYVLKNGSFSEDLDELKVVETFISEEADYGEKGWGRNVSVGIKVGDEEGIYLSCVHKVPEGFLTENMPSYLSIRVEKYAAGTAEFEYQDYVDDVYFYMLEQAGGELDLGSSAAEPVIDVASYYSDTSIFLNPREVSTDPNDLKIEGFNKAYKFIVDGIPKLLESSGSNMSLYDLGFAKLA